MKTSYLDLILVFVVGLIIYLCMKKSANNKPGKQNKISKREDFTDNCKDSNYDSDDQLEKLLEFTQEDMGKFINPTFTEGQFHNDYRDTITAFNNIAPSQKQIFNQGNIPIVLSNPPVREVKKLIRDFITFAVL